MIRLALETTDDLHRRIQRLTNDVITNVYDDVDVILPEWADSPDDFLPSKQKPVTENMLNNYPPQFSTKSILLNTAYSNYSYPKYSIYKP